MAGGPHMTYKIKGHVDKTIRAYSLGRAYKTTAGKEVRLHAPEDTVRNYTSNQLSQGVLLPLLTMRPTGFRPNDDPARAPAVLDPPCRPVMDMRSPSEK